MKNTNNNKTKPKETKPKEKPKTIIDEKTKRNRKNYGKL